MAHDEGSFSQTLIYQENEQQIKEISKQNRKSMIYSLSLSRCITADTT
jgi:hypothetical protein